MEGQTGYEGQSLVEKQEQDRKKNALFLGGIFSAGGRMAINTEQSKKTVGGVAREYTYAYPVIAFNSDNESVINGLVEKFGGKKTKSGKFESYRWSLKSNDAVDLALSMKGAVPYREEAIAAFELWEHSDLEERLLLAKEFNTTRSDSDSRPELYTELTRQPQFIAGILTARGLIYTRERDGHQIQSLQLNSKNRPLLLALQSNYTGSITNTSDASNMISFGHEATATLTGMSKEYLLAPLNRTIPKTSEQE